MKKTKKASIPFLATSYMRSNGSAQPVEENPVPVAPEPSPALKNHQLLWITCGAGLIASVLIAWAVYSAGNILPRGYTLMIASDVATLAPLRTVDGRGKEVAEVTVEGQGTAAVIDAATGGEYAYYLVGDARTVQLYSQDRANPAAGLTQLTSTPTLKYDLSLDAVSGAAAYVTASSTGETPRIIFYDAEAEKDLGPGTHPTLLPGGFFVVFQRDTEIVSVNTQTGEMNVLLSVTQGAPFAVDAERMIVALYEPTTSTIQTYSVAGMTAASFLEALPAAPMRELAYAGGKLIEAHLDEESRTVRLISGRRAATASALFDDLASNAFKLTVSHD